MQVSQNIDGFRQNDSHNRAKPIRDFFNFHYLPKLYIGFKFNITLTGNVCLNLWCLFELIWEGCLILHNEKITSSTYMLISHEIQSLSPWTHLHQNMSRKSHAKKFPLNGVRRGYISWQLWSLRCAYWRLPPTPRNSRVHPIIAT